MSQSRRKGIESDYLFLLFSIILGVVLVGAWQVRGMEIAQERLSELKILTLTQVKNVLFSMQYAPIRTSACVSLMNCQKLILHRDYIEIWGPANDYYSEGPYVSTSLIGDAILYKYNESSKVWEQLTQEGYTTTCGTKGNPLYLCFKKVEEDKIYIFKHI